MGDLEHDGLCEEEEIKITHQKQCRVKAGLPVLKTGDQFIPGCQEEYRKEIYRQSRDRRSCPEKKKCQAVDNIVKNWPYEKA